MHCSDKYSRLPVERLAQIVSYDPLTGVFKWKRRPEARPEWNTRYAGKVIDCPAKSGYMMLGYRHCGVKANYLLHRAAIAIMTGNWPTGEVDHINGDRHDNRISNLRVVCSQQNRMNTCKVKSPVGFKGVFMHPDTGRFRATIRKDGKNHYLGYFSTAVEAAKAYDSAALSMFGEHAKTNSQLGLIDA